MKNQIVKNSLESKGLCEECLEKRGLIVPETGWYIGECFDCGEKEDAN